MWPTYCFSPRQLDHVFLKFRNLLYAKNACLMTVYATSMPLSRSSHRDRFQTTERFWAFRRGKRKADRGNISKNELARHRIVQIRRHPIIVQIDRIPGSTLKWTELYIRNDCTEHHVRCHSTFRINRELHKQKDLRRDLEGLPSTS